MRLQINRDPFTGKHHVMTDEGDVIDELEINSLHIEFNGRIGAPTADIKFRGKIQMDGNEFLLV